MSNTKPEPLKSHPDGSCAVAAVQAADALLYEASGPDGLSVGVYDTPEQATSAANWAWDLLTEQPELRRIALLQLIVQKLCLQYPDDTAEASLGATGE